MPATIQDVPVAPSALNETDAPPGESRGSAAARRSALYFVVVLALGVALWALVKGGDRDLWTQPAALLSMHTW